MDKVVFCLMGPTASGKTELALQLARLFPLELISVDSALIYRGMDIGTAKPDKPTLTEFPHALIDILDPSESYSASLFCQQATDLCEAVFAQGRIPLLVGGTMLYFQALQDGLSALPPSDEVVRDALKTQPLDELYARLRQVDLESADRIHPHDPQRILRALEVYELTKKPMSSFFHDERPLLDWRFVNLKLMPMNRAWLHERIEKRFDLMLESGFLQEVKTLHEQWALDSNYPAMRLVGYRQALAYLMGDDDFETFRMKGLAATRQLAKRQMTWLRRIKGISCDPESPKTLAQMIAIVQQILDNGTIND